MLNALQSKAGGLAPEEEDMRNSAIVIALAAVLGASRAGAVTVHVPGYSYAPFVTTTAVGAEDVELDPSGNVYLCASGDIRRITPEGVQSPWSSAPAYDIAFAPDGTAYGAGRGTCYCVLSISPSGAYSSLHADSLVWSFVAVGQGGTIYSNIQVGAGKGVYTLNPTTGVPTRVVDGGPGADGTYSAMMVGQDGKLYLTGYDGGVSTNIYRLDGNQLTSVGNWPHGGQGLAQDNQAIFYTSVTIVPQFGPLSHEVWMFDPRTDASTLLAEGGGPSYAVAYDRARNVLYVQNGNSVYMITKSATPTRRETWSAVKAKFR
jgi:hypothetical protein